VRAYRGTLAPPKERGTLVSNHEVATVLVAILRDAVRRPLLRMRACRDARLFRKQ
jgi:hypothetical protein